MLRVAPWLALLLTGCEAMSGREAGPEVAPVTGATLAETGPLRAAIAAGVRRRSENEASYEVDAFVAALAVEELASGTGGVRVEPAVERGAQVGYRLTEVVPGSVYERIGLRTGDVVEALGEVRLDSPGRAAGALARLERGGQVTVSRDGVGFSLELRVAGGLAWAELLRSRTGSPGQVAGDMPSRTGPLGQVPEDRWVADGEPPAGPRDGEAGGTPVVSPGGGALPGTPTGSRPTGAGKPSRGSTGSGVASPAGSTGTSPAGKTGVQCASATSCTLEKQQFDAALADPSKLERQASISPARGGYKLTRVTPGSTVAALGFRAGDVIVSVNGARLDDDMAALGLYMGLEGTRKFNVTYERNGARASKAIALR
ncbi:PDZ domain-containing protein [Nannocystis bainbridge]|uniref:PDZ domain-containing protein n=1 Tax=Nannocystis bainbridge TaxID=2995303 RepID=A0ABT5E1Z8_9BACT|nr:PDZ domain-containing protein [Nannocystis bainbridge]MDC0719458.1 PDZ domain-containing protein [Nannocystis bainbridge]